MVSPKRVDNALLTSSPVSTRFLPDTDNANWSCTSLSTNTSPSQTSPALATTTTQKATPPPELSPLTLTPAAAAIVAAIRALCNGEVPVVQDKRAREEDSGAGRASQEENQEEAGASGAASCSRHFPCNSADWDSLQAYLASIGPRPGETETGEDASSRLWRFHHDKVRLEAFCDYGFAVLRMPTDEHEWFKASLEEYILKQVRAVQGRVEVAAAAGEDALIYKQMAGQHSKAIEAGGSASIWVSDEAGKKWQRQPDVSFYVREEEEEQEEQEEEGEKKEEQDEEAAETRTGPIAGLVIEVAHSQNGKELNKRAHEYLLGTGGDHVKVVLGFQFEYRGKANKSASVTVFRRKEEEEGGRLVLCVTSEKMLFESPAGHLIPGRLSLALNDFGPSIDVPLEHQQIPLDFAGLYECRHKNDPIRVPVGGATTPRPRRAPVRAWGKNVKRMAPESSSEEDTSELDKRIKADVQRGAKRQKEDAAYQPTGAGTGSGNVGGGNVDGPRTRSLTGSAREQTQAREGGSF